MKWTTRWICDVVVNVKLNTFRSQLKDFEFVCSVQGFKKMKTLSQKYRFYWKWSVSNNFFFSFVRIHGAKVNAAAATAQFLLSKKKREKNLGFFFSHTHTRNLNFMWIICFRMTRNCVVDWMQMERKLIKIYFPYFVVFNFPRRKKIAIDCFPLCAHAKHMLTDARIHQLHCLQSIGECARNGWGNLKIDNNIQTFVEQWKWKCDQSIWKI